MTRNRAQRIIAAALAVSVAACAAIERNPRAAKGTVVGAVTGAAAGSAIGAIAGGGKGAGKGAAIGAVVGALGGGLIGSYLDQQAREMEALLAEQDYLRREQEKLQVVMASDVLFESGKAYIQPGARDKLGRLAQVLNRYPRTRVQIIGHTDSRGSEESNYELSRRRAQAVADILVENGVSAARIATRGEGESRPIASNDTPEGRAKNRRVEIDIVPDESFRAEPAGEPYEEPR